MNRFASFSAVFLLALAGLTGCASHQSAPVISTVGPRPTPTNAAGEGTLVVFSAADPNANFNSLPYKVFYSDYTILSEDGKFVKRVHNSYEHAMEGPRSVSLPAGTYQVVARANGYGEVKVPVVLAAGRTTNVHLEGGRLWQKGTATASTNPVQLPNGVVVGWRVEN